MLNCGLRMRPTAGTANGVHPVPAGFSRVYVDLGKEKFTPELWQQRLNEGRSFVTTGPMLMLKHRDAPYGFAVRKKANKNGLVEAFYASGSIASEHPIERVEIIVNGEVAKTSRPQSERQADGHFVTDLSDLEPVHFDDSIWVALRCFEKTPNGRTRFAHSAPAFVDFADSPVRPRRDQVRYLIQRCEEELARNKELLSDAELAEYREALEFYRGKLPTAR
jgi:hypothetical protein